METIKTYLDNVFKSLPQTSEIRKIKADLLGNMEAKFDDLRAAGKSEHEATALVIGEFGNIDELLTELGISPHHETAPAVPRKIVNRNNISAFLSANTRASLLIAAGVALIIVGASILIGSAAAAEGFGLNEDFAGTLGVVFLLLLIVPAVGFFIYSGFLMEKYNYLESGEFTLSAADKEEIEREYETKRSRYIMGIITGVGLILLSAAILIAVSVLATLRYADSSASVLYADFAVSFFLCMVAAAVFILIRAGMADSAYKKLLQTGDYAPQTRDSNKVVGAVASVVWPLVTGIFLAWGFLFDGWHIAWVVFPITGVLFGGFAGFYNALKGK